MGHAKKTMNSAEKAQALGIKKPRTDRRKAEKNEAAAKRMNDNKVVLDTMKIERKLVTRYVVDKNPLAWPRTRAQGTRLESPSEAIRRYDREQKRAS